MHEALGRYPVSVSIPVAWGEMDAFQHVNNVAYAHWLETGRIAYFGRIGFLDRMKAEGIGPILAKLTVEYRRPVTFPDRVRVDVTATKIGRSSFTLAYRVFSTAQEAEVAPRTSSANSSTGRVIKLVAGRDPSGPGLWGSSPHAAATSSTSSP